MVAEGGPLVGHQRHQELEQPVTRRDGAALGQRREHHPGHRDGRLTEVADVAKVVSEALHPALRGSLGPNHCQQLRHQVARVETAAAAQGGPVVSCHLKLGRFHRRLLESAS